MGARGAPKGVLPLRVREMPPKAAVPRVYIRIRYWMCVSVCSAAIETTFPLFNYKTKHIFGILMTLRKIFKTMGAVGAP